MTPRNPQVPGPRKPCVEHRLSVGQEALWLLNETAPASKANHIACAAWLSRDVDLTILRSVLSTVFERHSSFRTAYALRDGIPMQSVRDTTDFQVDVIDGAAWDERELRRHVQADMHRPFDLEQDLLCRVTLFTRSNREPLLLLAAHHIALDGWSLWLCLKEIGGLYAARKQGAPDPRGSRGMNYLEFAKWQEGWLASGEAESDSAFWEKQLAEPLPTLDLPTDWARSTEPGSSGAGLAFGIDEGLTARLKELAVGESVTLNSILLSVFQLLLHRYCQQDDILIGCPTAARGRSEFRRTVGYFVNPVAVRADLSGDPTFCDLLKATASTLRSALEHQNYPLGLLVNRETGVRDGGRTPIFQASFVYQKPTDPARLGALFAPDCNCPPVSERGLNLGPLTILQHEDQLDISLEMAEYRGALSGVLKYRADLFGPGMIAQMVESYLLLLETVLRNPDQNLSAFPLLSEEQKARVLAQGNGSSEVHGTDACLLQMFDRQLASSGNSVAIVHGDESLTFQELDAKANQLGRQLQAAGIGPGKIVALCMERGPQMLVSLLGILKAGAAYLPLDPAYPRGRLHYMLEDCGAALVLMEQPLRESLGFEGVQTLCVDEQAQQIGSHSSAPFDGGAQPEDLAFVIYTSGSSGKPKGVAMPRSGIANLVEWQLEETTLPRGARTLQFTSLSFDVSIQEIFTAWCSGGPLVLVEENIRRDMQRLAAFIVEHKIERLYAPFVVLRQLANELCMQSSADLALREIITAGEQLHVTPELVQLFENLDGCVLINQYGPTESHVATAFRLPADPSSWPALPPIGRPIANVQVYLLDTMGEPVPQGALGEICIAGAGLARGYVNNEPLTELKFRPNRIDAAGSARIYRTGDLGRYRADGEIEFHGRQDEQVKVRGYRVEPGEVETHLCSHAALREGAVVLEKDGQGRDRLTAYFVASGHRSPSARELTGFLAERLPRFMVPTAYVQLAALPLTASGKLDRSALPAAEVIPCSQEQNAMSLSPVGELVAGIWADILGLQSVAPEDDFFALGGHSLLATQVASRVRDVLGVELPLRAIFEAPTLAGVVARIEELRDSGLNKPVALPMTRAARAQGIPLSFSQERMWFLHELAPQSAAYNMGGAFRLTGQLDVQVAKRSLEEIIQRHENLRTTFHSEDGTPVMRISSAASLHLTMEDLRHLPRSAREQEVRERSCTEIRVPFDLEKGPLFRTIIYQLAEEEHVVLFCMHHVISDLWTFGVLFQELSDLYAANKQGLATPLSEPTLQYADFAVWQRAWLKGEVLEEQVGYWRKQLAGISVLEFPEDKPRPAIRTDNGALQSIELQPELIKGLKALSIREGVTPFMTLLAVFKLLLMRSTGQRDLVVGSPIANRTRLEVEPMMGTFVNTLVMRTDLSGDPTFRELLRRVRETTLGAFAHQDLPFEKLVEELQPERDMSHSPLVQVLFNLANAPFQEPQMENLAWSPLEIDRGAAQFELSLFVDLEVTGKAYGEYNTDIFEADTIRRFLDHFCNALQSLIEDPDQRLSTVPLLGEGERKKILSSWNQTATEYSNERCFHELFERQCESSAGRVALSYLDDSISYEQLNLRANRVAHKLRSCGAKPGVLVGIFMERSVDMVVALLGVLKSGAAYLPLDPTFPGDRLAFMLQDAAAPILITQEDLVGALPAHAAQVLLVEKMGSGFRGSESNPEPMAGPEDLAYVIYTSGSTGKPKGVQIPHRALVNFLESMGDCPGLERDDVLLALTTLSFDIAGLELFLPLLVGAHVVIATREEAYDGHKLIAAIGSSGATVMQATPTSWRMLIDSGWEGGTNLKALCGGEALSRELADQLLSRCESLWNMYGPTETTIWSAVSKVEAQGPVVIGRPIANTELYLLDENLQPVPVGVPGQLYIGGNGVARGYLNRPDLTAERFLPNPFSKRPGDRIHNTGDLARWLPDGRVECLARTDNQVKVRGFRIDLGEVEAAIAGLREVANNVVVAREDSTGLKRLIAYVVPAQDFKPTMVDLRAQLKLSLPDYMIPSALVLLERLPQTPNGKVDRLALPAADNNKSAVAREIVKPRTPIERTLTEIWCEVLELDEVGVNEDFFDLGGHSLLAARLADRIRKKLGIELPLRSMFDDFCVAGIAQKLAYTTETGAYEFHAETSQWASLVPIQPRGTRGPFFLVPGTYSEESAFLGYMANLVPHLGSDQPVISFRARGMDGKDEPHLSAVQMATDYLAEMRSFQPSGPYFLGGECVGGVVAFEMARQLREAGEDVALLVLLDTVRPSAQRSFWFHAHHVRTKACSILGHLRRIIFQPEGAGRMVHLAKLLKRKRKLHLPLTAEERAENRIGRIERNYSLLMFRYRPKVYSGRLTLLVNEEEYQRDPEQGWHDFAEKGVESHCVPGNHLTRITKYVGATAKHLNACLDAARRSPRKGGGGDNEEEVA